MGIVLTGSSFGGIIHPIMHNQLFHGKTGFAWGVRASAFLILGLLVIANCIMTTRLPPKREGPKPNFGAIFRDVPYMIASFAVFKGSASGRIVEATTHRALNPDSVVVKITHSGLCFTDFLFRKKDMVLGHEGVGIVESVGPACKHLKP